MTMLVFLDEANHLVQVSLNVPFLSLATPYFCLQNCFQGQNLKEQRRKQPQCMFIDQLKRKEKWSGKGIFVLATNVAN